MRHPFDGLNHPDAPAAPRPTEDTPDGLDRRSALGKMVFAAAGFVALPSALTAKDQVITQAVNEDGKGVPPQIATTLALGEEAGNVVPTAAAGETGAAAVTTEPFGEESGKVTSRAVPGVEDGGVPATTQAAREEAGGPLTRAANEQGGFTTQALGEEGATTDGLNEEGGVTTKALNEEGGPVVTLAINEEGGPLTRAKGEEGMGRIVQVKPESIEVAAKQLEAAWTDLGSKESSRAVQGCAVIYGAKQAVPFLKENLKVKFTPAEPRRVAQLIADLDSDVFATREAAEKELRQMGPAALPAMRQALAQAGSPEVRRRLQNLVDGSKDLPLLLQAQRGLQVLVALKTPEAKGLIEQLAKGDEKDWLTQAAKDALAQVK